MPSSDNDSNYNDDLDSSETKGSIFEQFSKEFDKYNEAWEESLHN